MNKKKRRIVIILMISIGIFFIYGYIKENNNYTNIIKSNWQIELPSGYKVIYSCDSGDSFLGDGQRYHVFEYKENSNIDKTLNWKSDKDINIESDVFKIISSLDTPDEYLPKFEEHYKYYYQTESYGSKLYIILSENKDIIYIIENFQ